MQLMSFNLIIEQKYCFQCAAKDTCRMARWFSYAERCDRYPHGPGFIKEDKEYQKEMKELWEATADKNSELYKQIKELMKLEI